MSQRTILALTALASLTPVAMAAPKVVLLSLDGANPAILAPYVANGDLAPGTGMLLLESKGVKATRNNTINPSLTAAAHVAIATGSSAATNDVVSNSYQLLASPFNGSPASGFGGPIGGYSIDGPMESAFPTAEPLWIGLRASGKKVATATWPGGDGVNVTIPGLTGTPGSATNPIVQSASKHMVDYTVGQVRLQHPCRRQRVQRPRRCEAGREAEHRRPSGGEGQPRPHRGSLIPVKHSQFIIHHSSFMKLPLLIAAVGLLAANTGQAAVSLALGDSFGDPSSVSINPGESFTVTLTLSSTAEFTTGISYFLAANGLGNGGFRITGLDVTGSDFSDLMTGTGVSLSPANSLLSRPTSLTSAPWRPVR